MITFPLTQQMNKDTYIATFIHYKGSILYFNNTDSNCDIFDFLDIIWTLYYSNYDKEEITYYRIIPEVIDSVFCYMYNKEKVFRLLNSLHYVSKNKKPTRTDENVVEYLLKEI